MCMSYTRGDSPMGMNYKRMLTYARLLSVRQSSAYEMETHILPFLPMRTLIIRLGFVCAHQLYAKDSRYKPMRTISLC